MSTRRRFLRKAGLGLFGASGLWVPEVAVACFKRCRPYPSHVANCQHWPQPVALGPGPYDMTDILLHVNTTGDDKDKEIQFSYSIVDYFTQKVLGVVFVGAHEKWDNGDHREFRIPIVPYAYQSRGSLQLVARYQNIAGGNHGWEGRLWASAIMPTGIAWVRSDTRDFKLGESGNPHIRIFNFDL